MTARRYTLVTFGTSEPTWAIHKPGCDKIAQELNASQGTKTLIKVDLEDSDEDLLEDLGADEEATIEDVDLCVCTGYAQVDDSEHPVGEGSEGNGMPSPTGPPQPSTVAAAASRAAAAARLLQQVEEIIDKLVITRGVDDVGEGDEWQEEKLPSCTDDYVYDLAVEVRKLRERGDSWWRVGYELGLPGSGASNKQGRKGGAYARRVWRAAWGKTYLGDRSQRESKITREARAMENLGRSYFSEADEDAAILKRVTGQMIHWVVRLQGTYGLITSAQETYVHDDANLVRVKQGPKGRYLEFYEQVDAAQLRVDPRLSIAKSGPLRAVYVDRITRVGV